MQVYIDSGPAYCLLCHAKLFNYHFLHSASIKTNSSDSFCILCVRFIILPGFDFCISLQKCKIKMYRPRGVARLLFLQVFTRPRANQLIRVPDKSFLVLQ